MPEHAPDRNDADIGADIGDPGEVLESLGLESVGIDPKSGDCGEMLHRLYRYLDGELTVERRHVIQQHLDGCTSCFSVYDFEAELRIVITERVRARVPAELVERIRQSLSDV
jgi:mycothiol system anti-sigma-R factor